MDIQKMNSSSTFSINLNKQKILYSIENNDKYEEEGILIRKWENSEKELFSSQINKNNIYFLGILNSRLEKEGYALFNYINGEKYFGNYSNDLRNRHGLYTWPSKIENKRRLSEFYWGTWKDNIKDGKGIYLWLNEPEYINLFSDFDKCDLDSYIGLISNDQYVKGVYLIKRNDNFYVYYGNFNDKGNKEDNECYYYNATKDKILYGKIVNDKFINGFICSFNEDGFITDILKVEFDDDNKIKSYQNESEIDKDLCEKVKNNIFECRNILLHEDHFTNLFNGFKSIIELRDNKMNDINILDSQDDYPDIMNKLTKYNDIKIFTQLSSNLIKLK